MNNGSVLFSLLAYGRQISVEPLWGGRLEINICTPHISAVSDNEQIYRVDEVYDVVGCDKSRVGALSEGQLEALCSEYLRWIYDDYVELISVGGSLSEADILAGVEYDSREIIAQVTFEPSASEVENKLCRLLA